MEAIVGGVAAAVCWAASVLATSRSTKRIGAFSTLGWVMIVGVAICAPVLAVTGLDLNLDGGEVGLLVASGASNIVGLLFAYTALRLGKVAVVAPIFSTEGAIGAVISIAAGEPLAAGTAFMLAVIAMGVLLAATEAGSDVLEAVRPRAPTIQAAALAVLAAGCFGLNLYVTGRIGNELPLAWAVLPARIAGLLGIALPLILARRLTLTRSALPFVLITGVTEVLGIAAFALAARGGIAVSSVIASQFAALAALASFALFHERLARHQVAGVAMIAAGVAVLSALQR